MNTPHLPCEGFRVSLGLLGTEGGSWILGSCSPAPPIRVCLLQIRGQMRRNHRLVSGGGVGGMGVCPLKGAWLKDGAWLRKGGGLQMMGLSLRWVRCGLSRGVGVEPRRRGRGFPAGVGVGSPVQQAVPCSKAEGGWGGVNPRGGAGGRALTPASSPPESGFFQPASGRAAAAGGDGGRVPAAQLQPPPPGRPQVPGPLRAGGTRPHPADRQAFRWGAWPSTQKGRGQHLRGWSQGAVLMWRKGWGLLGGGAWVWGRCVPWGGWSLLIPGEGLCQDSERGGACWHGRG